MASLSHLATSSTLLTPPPHPHTPPLPSPPCFLPSFTSSPFKQSLSRSLFFLPQHRHGRLGLRVAASGSRSSTPVDEEEPAQARAGGDRVSAVLFDMDGVLCDSEERSRQAAVDVFAELGVQVSASDFVPFMGTGEANFLGGVARVYGLTDFDPLSAKSRFFEIYLNKYAQPNSGLGYPGALELILQCKREGLKVAVASSADRLKVDANLAAAGLPYSHFDTIVSADAFENLKPAPDIFLAAAKALNVPTNECVVIEDALAGLQAAKAAGMRCIAVTTTLSEDKLLQGSPSLIRKDIGDISLVDILNLQKATDIEEKALHGTTMESQVEDIQEQNSASPFLVFWTMLETEISLPGGQTTTRREVLRFGSLAIALSSFFFTMSHLKAMSYASPKAILNALMGISGSTMAKTSEGDQSDRVVRFKHYISDLEARGGGQEVPEFQPKLEWLNTTPLQLHKDLQGKVLILDFWTYCCINCMHILPDLEFIEKKYKGQPLTVIGVHSAKFDNEKDSNAIRSAVLRYNVSHPVVNDGDMTMWRQLGVNSWPTFVLVSPRGRLIGMLAGEGHRQDLDDLVEASLQYYGEKKLLNYRPIPELLEKDKDTRLLLSPLKFPGKLATDLANQRLFISDSNHHRIVVTDLEGNFIQQVGGGGGEGLRDGSFDDAAFNRPQGVAYNSSKNVLYVTDTENHALREVDFVNETVQTLAGNGEKGSDYKGGKQGTSQVLNSPWDVCFEPTSGVLYIAMAGQHQIWKHNLADGTTRAFSGDGYERNLNGQRGSETSYAQPSGLSLAQELKEIYVADSESSSIRVLNLETGGSRLLAGGDPMFAENLFQFGDKDGVGAQAQFQHPLGVLCGTDGVLYIADSYNHKIKVLDPKSKKVISLIGTGSAGFKDGYGLIAQLSEPAGLAQGLNGKVYIADTNNSVIRVADLKADGGPLLSTLELKGVQPPVQAKAAKPRRLRRRPSSDTEVIEVEPVSAMNGDFQLEITLPSGFHFTKEASSRYEADVEPDGNLAVDPLTGTLDANGHASLHFRRAADASARVQILCKVYYCEEEEVCLYKPLVFQVPFGSSSSSPKIIPLSYMVKPPVVNGLLKAN